jgi:hypothetical protein
LFAQRQDLDGPPGVRGGKLPADIRSYAGQIALGHLHADSIAKPADEREALATTVPLHLGCQNVERPDIRIRRVAQPAGQLAFRWKP